MTSETERRMAEFLGEGQFHLGFLPTEQSNPKTRHLDEVFRRSPEEGVGLLLSVDRDIVPMARRVFSSPGFARLEDAMTESLASGHRLVFSGCGATGRLSILLETLWRRGLQDVKASDPAAYAHLAPLQDSVLSIMTGGDYALVRSVESFEDYAEFGRQQVREMHLGSGDTLVGITEGGETSSVLGTVEEAVASGASVFLVFNNPAEILHEHLERCRRVLDEPCVTVLDLSCGPMAVAGSTRMQATTSEQLVVGAALENAFQRLLRKLFGEAPPKALALACSDWASSFEDLLDELEKPESLCVMGGHIVFEEEIYRAKGRVTYYAERALLDIFTDTTERSPTFMLPPFRAGSDAVSAPPWAFVKHPSLGTAEAWKSTLLRMPRGLDWTSADYQRMGAAAKLRDNPPKLGLLEILDFRVGCERDASRFPPTGSAAVLVLFERELQDTSFPTLEAAWHDVSAEYRDRRVLVVGGQGHNAGFAHVDCGGVATPLGLMQRLAMKLVFNCISTGTMVRLGRVAGNWMSFVAVSNKKLMDRSVRLVAELCGFDYVRACRELFEAMEDLERSARPSDEKVSPVQHVIARHRLTDAEAMSCASLRE